MTLEAVAMEELSLGTQFLHEVDARLAEVANVRAGGGQNHGGLLAYTLVGGIEGHMD